MSIDLGDFSQPTWLSGYQQAFDELRCRASQAIARSDRLGQDIRQTKTRLRDGSGKIIFEGTMDEATRAYPELDQGGTLISAHALQ